MAKSKASSASKKGPKGKKARAKAKLDRQWGEEPKSLPETRRKSRSTRNNNVTHDDKTNHQVSVSLDHQSEEQRNTNDDTNKDNDESDHDDDEQQACATLLETIRSQSNNRRPSDDDDDDDDSSNDNSMSGNESVLSDVASEHEKDLHYYDFFTERFSREPLGETTQQLLNQQQEPLTTFYYSSEVVQLSQSLASKLNYDANTSQSQIRKRAAAAVFNYNGAKTPQLASSSSDGTVIDQALLTSLLPTYADLLVATPRFARPTAIARHCFQHVRATRALIEKHSRQLRAAAAKDSTTNTTSTTAIDDGIDNNKYRDQGYTRPTVLVLLPSRGCCYSFVQTLLSFSNSNDSNANTTKNKSNNNTDRSDRDRFRAEYGPVPDDTAEDSAHRKHVLQQKGRAWNELFGDAVNADDDFCMGLQSTTNGSFKLFTDFYRSDVIVASPLALKMAASRDEEREADFLSSIHICVVARADVLLMQNWDHVEDIMSLLNSQPKCTKGIDFARVRSYMLEGQAAYWRQLIVSSDFMDPLILSAFKRNAKSFAGTVRVLRKVENDDSDVTNVLLPTRQVFQRISATSFASQSDDRVKYFIDKVLPQVLRHDQKHTMIFIPSYFDFVSVRNTLLRQEVDFVMISEYSRTTETSRARARFLQGRKPIMLYTGRAHFFYRHAIKGVRHLVFLGLPEHAIFYSEHLNRLNEGLQDSDGATASCLALFTKYEAMALERIVGKSNSARMLGGEKHTFLFS
jgi:U3 small nucleolar RNA-associated protein 25